VLRLSCPRTLGICGFSYSFFLPTTTAGSRQLWGFNFIYCITIKTHASQHIPFFITFLEKREYNFNSNIALRATNRVECDANIYAVAYRVYCCKRAGQIPKFYLYMKWRRNAGDHAILKTRCVGVKINPAKFITSSSPIQAYYLHPILMFFHRTRT